MTDPTEIARVAAGLTAEQFEVLLDIPNGESRRAIRFSGSVARNLCRYNSKRPALISARLTCAGRVAWFETTAPGMSVRDHILREKSGEGDAL